MMGSGASGTAFEAAFRRRRLVRLRAATLWGLALAAALWLSAWVSEVSPAALAAGLPRMGEYFGKLVPTLTWPALLRGPEVAGSVAYWFYRLDSWAWLLFETSQMAALATLGGTMAALLLCCPAASSLAPNRLVFVLCRRTLELLRTVPDIVYALILVWALGVGPLAGIAAMTLHTAGALGKLFAEVAENVDMQPVEGVKACGGSWAQQMRYGVLPQVLPNFTSYVLLRFEINIRGATVIGFVGAGGIGQELYTVISFNYYQEISAILVLIVLMVAALDLVSERVRTRLMAA
jgi:phosphonate transport system permease protein